jgi:hypothetical protein
MLADLAAPRGIGIWHHAGDEGQSLHAAIRFICAYANDRAAWPYEQLAGHLPYTKDLCLVLRRGSRALNEEAFKKALGNLPNEERLGSRVDLLLDRST